MMPRWLPRSLRGRMLLVSSIATLVALAIAGAVIAGLLGRFVIEGLDRRLDAEVALLASTVDTDGRVDRARLAQRIGGFEVGRGWRWRIEGPDGAIGSNDFPRPAAGPPAPPAPPGAERPAPPLAGPQPWDGEADDGERLHARQLVIETRRGSVTLTAAAPRGVVRRPIVEALTPLLLALAGLGALLTIALLVQLRVALRPVRRLHDEVAAIRAGQLARVDEDQPDELRPLAAELNALAADNEAALATARGSAANLAHALKTPVAALALDLAGQSGPASQVARIDRTIRHHLARARTAAINRRSATPLLPAASDLADAIRRLHDGVAIAVAVPQGLAVAIDPQDLDELLGNLVDNAARHAAGRVSVSARGEGRMVHIEVADDGPGIPAADRARMTQPGTRLDQRGDGHGFGLSIVAELAALYGGALTLGEAPEGGLLVTLMLPAA
ncbi:signal transduction histidine kinase [Sphingomonas jinjuensis]|uniref:histidine kinase n=1 Tax=Sphingomonas jinjuensis TaxID=535907 RepID=A0A840FA73_9SPHN|nr:HAMP domain-containing sensor histidine kinase [Sphingomonas jinjuensis]MBB4154549.1 signal transduction histidine kinase [Sphingomonas jinjuensis]